MTGLSSRSFRPTLENLEVRCQPSASPLAALAPPALPTAAAADQHVSMARVSAHGDGVTVLQQAEVPAAVSARPGDHATNSNGVIRGIWTWWNSARAWQRYEPYPVARLYLDPNVRGVEFRVTFSWEEFKWPSPGGRSVSLQVRPVANEPGTYELLGSPVFEGTKLWYEVKIDVRVYYQNRGYDIEGRTLFWVGKSNPSDAGSAARAGEREAAVLLTQGRTGLAAESAGRDQVFAARATQPAGNDRDAWAASPRPVGADASLPAAHQASPVATEALDAAFLEFALDSARAR